jgi:drug/metabolite transporter (DMT)-like permease
MTGTVGFTCLVHSLKMIPLFISTIIINTAPFISSLLAYFTLGDKVTKLEICLMTGCFSGVVALALAKGGYFEGDEADVALKTNEVVNITISTSQYIFGMSMMLVTACCFSGVTVMTRKMKEIHFSLLMFHYGAFASTLIGAYLIIEFIAKSNNGTYDAVSEDCTTFRLFCYDSAQWFLLLAVGICNAVSMNFMTIAS